VTRVFLVSRLVEVLLISIIVYLLIIRLFLEIFFIFNSSLIDSRLLLGPIKRFI